ncbi:MAG: 4-hydroxy-tetrahydrodipicolinate reductase [Magnetococcales bacterium]|nr:4-hydroxy-tetrahydrodipicolinate reductase [Magnetococcales bacterium]
MAQVDIAVLGAAGRMGRMLVTAVSQVTGLRLVGATEQDGSPFLGRDAGEVAGIGPVGVAIGSQIHDGFAAGRVAIDFTLPQATRNHLQRAVEHHTGLVVGTTGLTEGDVQQLTRAAQDIPIVFAPNFSIGVNLMFKVAAQVASTLGETYDIEIIEAHHRHKVDAPSGTALGLGRAVAGAMGKPLQDVAVYAREGHTGARVPGSIGFATVRGGDIVGDHTVLFAGEGERFEVTHKASSRMTFARGAVQAALWLNGKPPGLYTMRDVLGF